MADTELLPCPFCGGDAQTDFIEGESYLIECYACRAETGIKDSEEDAIAAWNRRAALASRPAELDDTTSTLNNPPYGQPDLYSRLHTALANESMLAKKFGKLPEWFSAVRGLIDWMEHESKSAPSHTTNKEKIDG